MLTLTKLQQAAKSVKIKNWWKMKKADLIVALKKHHTVNNEAELEFVIEKGITQCPDAPNQIEANNDEKCAGTKVDHDKLKEIADSKKEAKKRRKPRKAKSSDKKESKKASKKAKAPEGSTTLAAICEELGVEPRIARRKLRNSDITKPEAGWAWTDAKEIKKVKELIK